MAARWRQALRKVEGDPATQYKIHKIMARAWIIMTPVVIAVCVLAPGIWLRVSIVYVVVISHYANWAGDQGACSAADAAADETITAYAAKEAP